MSFAHVVEDESPPESGNADRATSRPVTVLYGEQRLASFSTVGRAMSQPLAKFPCGSRIVKGGVVKARFAHAVSEEGTVYAGWMLVAEKERRAR